MLEACLNARVEIAAVCRYVVCRHLHDSGRSRGQAAAATTGAPAAVEAAAAEDLLKVTNSTAKHMLMLYYTLGLKHLGSVTQFQAVSWPDHRTCLLVLLHALGVRHSSMWV